MSIGVIGTYHSKFGKSDDTIYEMMNKAVKGALDSACVDPEKIGGIWVGNYSGGGFNKQEHIAPLALDADERLRFTPATRVENACASGFAAIAAARNAILTGEIEYALVVGIEKMTSLRTSGVTEVLAMASHQVNEAQEGYTFPGLFAEFAKGYQKKYDISDTDMSEALQMIAAKNYKNALKNDKAQMSRDWTYEDIAALSDEKNPMIATPLRLHDCSLVSDGAAAIVLTTSENAKTLKESFVEMSSLIHVTDYMEISKRDTYQFEGAKKAVEELYKSENITVDDVDFAEVHDCFTIAELLAYEALGIAEAGKAIDVIKDGSVYPGGRLPVNASGGLKAKGHPVGATGVSMAVLATNQLMGTPIGEEVKNAKIGITLNLGGSAVNNYVALFRKK
ncbi:MAG: thiolase domain-containing protein [Clostridia bacterium]|nr:thiolase domain-containing protein [Clostridia bacterium]